MTISVILSDIRQSSSLDLLSLSLNLGRCPCRQTLKALRFSRACARLATACRFSVLCLGCRSTDGQAAMIATYFIFCGTKSAKRAENPCPSRKYLASTAIYRLYTFCCQFARGFFRISDKNFSKFKIGSSLPPPSVFSTGKMKLFHQKLSQLHKSQVIPCQNAACGRAFLLFHRRRLPLCGGPAYFRLNFSGSKSGSSQKRVMISV